jgi:hypothetical protein
MRKVSGIFLVGLCLGAAGAIVLTAQHLPATTASTRQIASTATPTSMSEPTPEPEPTVNEATATKTSPAKSSSPGKSQVDAATLDRLVPDGTIGAVVFDRQNGSTVLSSHADRPFASASLVKLFIALSVLEVGGPADQVQRMLSRSDDNLASTFWGTYGGSEIVTHWAGKIGLTGTKAPANSRYWGDTTVTASDLVRVYRYLLDRVNATTRNTILIALRDATENGSDGFRQYFGIPDAAGDRPWAIKQGWACCRPRPTRVLHTTGLVGTGDRYIVAVLTEQPQGVGWPAASKRVTSMVTALLPLLGG